jgi:hypothetical protein
MSINNIAYNQEYFDEKGIKLPATTGELLETARPSRSGTAPAPTASRCAAPQLGDHPSAT